MSGMEAIKMPKHIAIFFHRGSAFRPKVGNRITLIFAAPVRASQGGRYRYRARRRRPAVADSFQVVPVGLVGFVESGGLFLLLSDEAALEIPSGH